jgi:hypothetical protein
MVEVGWRLPPTRFGVCSLSSSIGNCWMDNLRLGGSIRGISGTLRREGQGEYCGYFEDSMWWPLPVSVMDGGLVPVSKYWTYRSHASVYGPNKPSSLPSIDTWLKPTTSLAGSGEKLRQVPWTTQSGWEVESGALFLGGSSIRPTLLMTRERLPRMGTARWKHRSSVHWL